ncbi:MAG: hypothetical protein C5B60_08175, partial [Chloroflexi bacterium]
MASSTSGQGLSFGATLKRYRRAAGMSQEELAVRAGYSIGYVSKLERSVRRPTTTTVELLANTLALDPSGRAALQTAGQESPGPQPVDLLHLSALQAPALPALVNRTHELARLERHLRGHGRSVMLFAGEPGIGKTRLLQEAAKQGQRLGWRVLESAHRQRSREEFYAPVLGALESYVRDQPPARLHSCLQGCTWL